MIGLAVLVVAQALRFGNIWLRSVRTLPAEGHFALRSRIALDRGVGKPAFFGW